MPFDPPPVAPRVAASSAAVPPPPIPTCRDWAARYGGEVGPLVDLTQAVPGYKPHDDLLDRLAFAARDPDLAGYGPLEGEADLREAVAEETRRLYGGDVGPEDVRISAGANTGFNLAMTGIAAPGETVVLPVPWFFNHQMALALRGVRAVPLACRTEDGFLPDAEGAAQLMAREGARALVLVTPNNPTGATLPAALMDRLAEACRANGAWLVLDETYRDFGEGTHALFRRADWRDFVVQLYSFSKAYCIPGHRMGSVIAGPALRAELFKAVDNIQLCPPRPPQAALAWAVPALREWRAANRVAIRARGDVFRRAIRRAPGWRIEAEGAYFAWVRVPDGGPDGMAVAERLAREAGLVTLPGAFFGPGGERHLRLAYANAPDHALREVPERLAMIG